MVSLYKVKLTYPLLFGKPEVGLIQYKIICVRLGATLHQLCFVYKTTHKTNENRHILLREIIKNYRFYSNL